MEKRWIIVILVILLLVLTCIGMAITTYFTLGPMLSGNVRFVRPGLLNVAAEATEQYSFQVETPAFLEVTNNFGDIEIKAAEGGASSEIDVTAVKKVWGENQSEAEALLSQLNIVSDQDGDHVTIRVEWPQPLGSLGRTGSVNFTILVPQEIAANGATRSGQVTLYGTQGDAILSSDFGDVRADDVTGDLSIQTRNGKALARNVRAGPTGDIELYSDFGEVTLERAAAGSVKATSRNGVITLREVESEGPVLLNSQFGDISYSSGSANTLEAKTRNGKVKLTNVEIDEEITANSEFGNLELIQASGAAYDLYTSGGSITADYAQGPLKAYTRFGDIDIRGGSQANLDLESRSGGIAYQGSLGEGPHRLHTEFGAVRLSLPAESRINFNMKTDFGAIRSDFDITVRGDLTEKHWQGTINGGGAAVNVTTRNGNITLEATVE